MTGSGGLSSPMRVAGASPARSGSGISPTQKLAQTSDYDDRLFHVEVLGRAPRPLPPHEQEKEEEEEDLFLRDINNDVGAAGAGTGAEMSLRDISMTEMETLQERYVRCEQQLSDVREQAKESMAARQRYIQVLKLCLVFIIRCLFLI